MGVYVMVGETAVTIQSLPWMEIIKIFAPVGVIFTLLLFILNKGWDRLKELQSNKVDRKVCQVVEGNVNKKLDEMKSTNGRVEKKLDSHSKQITRLETKLDFIVDAVKKNGGVSSNA